MPTEYVYHVVTERPMTLRQKIIFDENRFNGVYGRVMAFQKILNGETVQRDLADLINADINRWACVAYRELALEKVRIAEYPDYPSRLACLYTSRTMDEAKKWAQFFQKIGRNVYAIVKLESKGHIFDGDACNCFDGTTIEEDNVEKARHYWRKDMINEKPVIETLIDGEITVVEIVEDFSAVVSSC